jgi:UDP-N-acetyl-D-glucosamine dehydrogenase
VRIAVVGLGHIGLPLAVQYATRGHDVIGIDVDDRIVGAIAGGHSPHDDERALVEGVPRLVAEGRLRAATWDSVESLHGLDAAVVIVPVVVDAEREIDFRPIDAATRDLARRIGPGTLVAYETTLPVGTTRNRFGPVLAEGSGLTLDEDLFLAFCAAIRRSSAGRARRARGGPSTSIVPSSTRAPRSGPSRTPRRPR